MAFLADLIASKKSRKYFMTQADVFALVDLIISASSLWIDFETDELAPQSSQKLNKNSDTIQRNFDALILCVFLSNDESELRHRIRCDRF